MFKTLVFTAEPGRKTKISNQKSKIEVNLRLEMQINVWVQTPKNLVQQSCKKLNSWFTLIGPL